MSEIQITPTKSTPEVSSTSENLRIARKVLAQGEELLKKGKRVKNIDEVKKQIAILEHALQLELDAIDALTTVDRTTKNKMKDVRIEAAGGPIKAKDNKPEPKKEKKTMTTSTKEKAVKKTKITTKKEKKPVKEKKTKLEKSGKTHISEIEYKGKIVKVTVDGRRTSETGCLAKFRETLADAGKGHKVGTRDKLVQKLTDEFGPKSKWAALNYIALAKKGKLGDCHKLQESDDGELKVGEYVEPKAKKSKKPGKKSKSKK